jgi:uroporphyrin-III C-methyltransferase
MRPRVTLIGAGPGDPELMTLRAVRALGEADVILIDDLVDRRCLAHARPGARIVEVGKRGGCRSTPQEFIGRLMVRCAHRGRTVARLKGGDPFVFGRGGEELQALEAEGIEVEVIPGVTAGVGAPASLGIPVTHRDLARGVTFVTGHAKEGCDPDWQALARSGTTLVVYMGLRRLPQIALALRRGGLPADTPACAIQDGTRETQRQVVSTLAGLPAAVLEAGIGTPALIVIGEVVRFARRQSVKPREKAA